MDRSILTLGIAISPAKMRAERSRGLTYAHGHRDSATVSIGSCLPDA